MRCNRGHLRTRAKIMEEEIEIEIKNGKNDTAPGPDEVLAELLKLLNHIAITSLTISFDLIFRTGQIPKAWIPHSKNHTHKTFETCGTKTLISPVHPSAFSEILQWKLSHFLVFHRLWKAFHKILRAKLVRSYTK